MYASKEENEEMSKSKTKNIHADAFAARDYLDVKIVCDRSGFFSVQLVPSLLASFHQKNSIQNSIDTQRRLYMQDMDPGPAKNIAQTRETKGDTQKMPQPYKKAGG